MGQLAGGIGLFLLAMKFITDGLKLAGGDALRNILGRWTRTPAQGIATGCLLTALVQSSSAVTVATIGFVNAGLLSLFQAVGVIYGTNIGTTMTAWLVAALGFNIKVELFALPMIGIGVPTWFFFPTARKGAIGQVLAGFGLFFIGIDTLKTAFQSISTSFSLAIVSELGVIGVILLVGIGFLLTVLTQSSSAAIAMTLTAASGGMLALPSAAAMVIGANLGTTSTAFFTSIGATPNAKRVAAAHIIFNAFTGVVALMILPLLIWLILETGRVLRLEDTPSVVLALFHTTFNIMGVILLWPMTKRLVAWLRTKYRTAEEDEGRPKYLDGTVTATPALALNALLMEVDRIGELARETAASVFMQGKEYSRRLQGRKDMITQLIETVGTFMVTTQRLPLNDHESVILTKTLRAMHYVAEGTDLLEDIVGLHTAVERLSDPSLKQELSAYQRTVAIFLSRIHLRSGKLSSTSIEQRFTSIEQQYQTIKDRLLRRGTTSSIGLHELDHLLDLLSQLNRILERQHKAVTILSRLLQERDLIGNRHEEKANSGSTDH
ncbi:MAG: Na/Pi cotransporter family protein [Nitrospirales bacterium]|nr:Na/Pi cotransporter family protein [Nitrospira sp.]MDR4502160.1 Na/Pi cotransporter family protein [Nitrospirales bacterium]